MDFEQQHLPLDGANDAPLFNTTFVVVDLETTGLNPQGDHIIEIGAVKTRAGEIVETFSTFIDPGMEIPSHITKLTGITTADVENAPQLGTAMNRFLEFARGTVWVAHNAKFDMGFLRQACIDLRLEWPSPTTVDTLTLARRTINRAQVGSYRLSNLARFVGSAQRPTHRALDDARATVDVLYYLVENLAGENVETAAQLVHYSPTVDPEIRAKRHLAEDAPHAPGVYVFRSRNGDPLYIGTALDLRRRLLQYFNGSDSRRKITEMVKLADHIDIIECPHGFAAEVREARLISALRPPYNRQRTEPTRGWYIVPTTATRPPKISRVASSASSLGPFRTRDTATAIRDRFSALNDDFAITTAQIASSGADQISDMIAEISALAEAHRFQRAALQRDRTAEFIFSLDKQQRLSMLASIPSLQAAFPDGHGGWHLAEIRFGRLAGAATAPRGADMGYIIDLMENSAQTVKPDDSLYKGASIDELSIIWKWLQRPEVRIKPTGGEFSYPRLGAGKFLQWAVDAQDARRQARREP
ncbi:MAG: DEDD exonuclease domain-containing protein [Corynebacterium sp.]|uniref:DEDD exonuclease domain-containing protein n=1 Tax=Corynebacterium sp. TaxID=1720 RepID=UPI0026DC55C9|nr:DEDD exonuclease domain-containing protein [Corynebacterium sp.]MDO5029669.1 DEDD exonuclease domain-containing protein [Corynebacterium sp.]